MRAREEAGEGAWCSLGFAAVLPQGLDEPQMPLQSIAHNVRYQTRYGGMSIDA